MTENAIIKPENINYYFFQGVNISPEKNIKSNIHKRVFNLRITVKGALNPNFLNLTTNREKF